MRTRRPNEARRALYDRGLNDHEIARAEGIHRVSIREWRVRNGLPPKRGNRGNCHTPVCNTKPPDRSDKSKRMQAYRSGLSDIQIARAEGVDRSAIRGWRETRGLASNSKCGRYLAADENAVRMLLYQMGWPDQTIASTRKVSRKAIREWRDARGLKANLQPAGRKPVIGIDGLLTRVRRSIGRSLSPDIVDETASELCLALLNGSISLQEIETQARRFGNRTLEQFASRFGPRSIDEEMTEDGYTLLDTLPDESQSSWLEEMGATVF